MQCPAVLLLSLHVFLWQPKIRKTFADTMSAGGILCTKFGDKIAIEFEEWFNSYTHLHFGSMCTYSRIVLQVKLLTTVVILHPRYFSFHVCLLCAGSGSIDHE